MVRIRKLAVNPLPWIFTPAGYSLTPAVLEKAMRELREVGYSALHVDVPPSVSVSEYRALLEKNQFTPAPGYFSAAFSERVRHDTITEAAARHAAMHAELGLDTSFVAVDLDPKRLEAPGRGVEASQARIQIIAEGLAAAAGAARQEGVTFALHPHIGSPVETEAETRAVLDATAGSSLGFGPDTGHLFWGGARPEAIIADYADRVAAVHLKDVRMDGLDAARRSGDAYFPATLTHRVWTEPGRGVIDFDAVFAALPAAFDGWFVVEVDVPDAPTAQDSARIAYEFLASRYLQGALS